MLDFSSIGGFFHSLFYPSAAAEATAQPAQIPVYAAPGDGYSSGPPRTPVVAGPTQWFAGAFNPSSAAGVTARYPSPRSIVPMFQGFGNSACFETARAMLARFDSRLEPAGVYDGLVATGGPNSPGQRYINWAINAGLPVMVGLNFAEQRDANPGAPGEPGHAAVLQRCTDPLTNTAGLFLFDPGSLSVPVARVAVDTNGNLSCYGYHAYTIASAIPYASVPPLTA